eukprot:655635-Prorocentrum_minimum.AAC.2
MHHQRSLTSSSGVCPASPDLVPLPPTFQVATLEAEFEAAVAKVAAQLRKETDAQIAVRTGVTHLRNPCGR